MSFFKKKLSKIFKRKIEREIEIERQEPNAKQVNECQREKEEKLFTLRKNNYNEPQLIKYYINENEKNKIKDDEQMKEKNCHKILLKNEDAATKNEKLKNEECNEINQIKEDIDQIIKDKSKDQLTTEIKSNGRQKTFHTEMIEHATQNNATRATTIKKNRLKWCNLKKNACIAKLKRKREAKNNKNERETGESSSKCTNEIIYDKDTENAVKNGEFANNSIIKMENVEVLREEINSAEILFQENEFKFKSMKVINTTRKLNNPSSKARMNTSERNGEENNTSKDNGEVKDKNVVNKCKIKTSKGNGEDKDDNECKVKKLLSEKKLKISKQDTSKYTEEDKDKNMDTSKERNGEAKEVNYEFIENLMMLWQ